ncbi:hypothetical protein IVB12_18655, partial [Bradyrhizobium sp. 179]|nr:hypothetical protein [Bradyrhizobium sp. 179]
MPIIRYFVFLSGLLLALLFAADRYLPAPVERAGAADPDRTTIRISSARSLPEKIVFDTRPRTDVPEMVQAEPTPEVPHQAMRRGIAYGFLWPIALESKRDSEDDSQSMEGVGCG